MIPANGFLNNDFEIVEQGSKTFYLDIDRNLIYGYTDGQEAMKQAIYLILSTERYQYVIFSRNYGIELFDLFGRQMTYVLPELKRRITEALLQDTRIKSLENFEFKVNKNKIFTTFTAVTIYGSISIEKVVTI